MNGNTKPTAATEDQARTITTIVIGGGAAGLIVKVDANSGYFGGHPEKYLLSFCKKDLEKRYFYRLEAAPEGSWQDEAKADWEQGALAADVEAQPMQK